MINYDDINVRAFQDLRAFARTHGQVAFARMVTAALGCVIADDPASHRHRWAVERVQGVLDQIGVGWPATDAAKLDLIQATETSPSAVLDAAAAEELAAFALDHGEFAFCDLVTDALRSEEHGPGDDWAIERVNHALDAIASAEERGIFRSISIHDFRLAAIRAIDPNRPNRPSEVSPPNDASPRDDLKI